MLRLTGHNASLLACKVAFCSFVGVTLVQVIDPPVKMCVSWASHVREPDIFFPHLSTFDWTLSSINHTHAEETIAYLMRILNDQQCVLYTLFAINQLQENERSLHYRRTGDKQRNKQMQKNV